MPYRIYKQFIPCGQPGDPPDIQRNVFVRRITSGSYSGSDDIYDDDEEALIAADELDREDSGNYQGWGVYGNGRIYIPTSESIPTRQDEDIARKIKLYGKYPPEIIGFLPLTGSVDDIIWISGSNFYGTVAIGVGLTKTKEFRVTDNTLLRFRVPTGSITGRLHVYNYDRTEAKSTDDFMVVGTVVSPQTITNAIPRSGSPFTPIVIRGTNLQYTNAVVFGTKQVGNYFDIINDTTIETWVPPNANTAPLRIRDFNGNIYSTAIDFQIITPTTTEIKYFTPAYGPISTSVHIYGSYLDSVDRVAFGTTLATYRIINDNHVVAQVPSGSETAPIRVRNTGSLIVSSSDNFIVQKGLSYKPPVIAGFQPTSGSIGDIIIIGGNNLVGTIHVYFSGPAEARIRVINDNRVRVQVPAGAVTGPIRVVNNRGGTNSVGNFIII